ncbi:MAG: hypothetical protein LBS83_00735 [Holosporales bacterium]|nr:hypothetical protein [Holosporales bacterium]
MSFVKKIIGSALLGVCFAGGVFSSSDGSPGGGGSQDLLCPHTRIFKIEDMAGKTQDITRMVYASEKLVILATCSSSILDLAAHRDNLLALANPEGWNKFINVAKNVALGIVPILTIACSYFGYIVFKKGLWK